MEDRTALWIWKSVALFSLGTCAVTLFRAPSAAATRSDHEDTSFFSGRSEHESERDHGRPARGASTDLTRLSKAVDQARSPQARCMALSRLARSRDVDAVAVHHIATYAEPDHMIEVRVCATTALGETLSEDAIPELVELIDDSLPNVAEAALVGLMQFKDGPAREAVVEAARSGPESLRLSAMRALAVESDPQALTLITDALKNGRPELQDQLLYILGTTHDPRAVPTLHGYLTTGSRRMQYAALNALGELGGARAESVLVGVVRDNPTLASAACQALSRMDSEDATEVLLEAAEGDYGAHVAASALQALTQRRSPAITALMTKALDGSNMNQVNVAVEYFATHGIASAVPALAELAGRGGPYTWQVVHALGRIGTDDARQTVERLASTQGQAGQAALQVLSSMPGGMASARQVALAQLAKGGSAQAPQLLHILGNDDSPEAQAALLAAARSSDPQLSAQALNWLGQRKDPESVQMLEDMVRRGATPQQRASALGALLQTGHPSAQGHLRTALKDQSPEVRAHAVQALSETGGDAEPALLEATRDSDTNVANAATFALAQLATPGALSRLEELARNATASSPQALQALVNAAPDRARPIAEAFAVGADAQARLAAVQIAGMLPQESSKRILVSAVRSDDSLSVREALNQLGSLGLSHDELRGLLQPLTQSKDMPEDISQLARQMLGGT